MIVAKMAEKPVNHAVLKVVRAIEERNAATVPDRKAKMAASPRDLLVKVNQTRSYPFYSLFTRAVGRGDMEVDAAGEIKTTLNRCVNERRELDSNHCPIYIPKAWVSCPRSAFESFLRIRM